MTQPQPNAFCAGLRRALDLAIDRRDLLQRIADIEKDRGERMGGKTGGGLYQLNELIDTLRDQLLDAGGFLGDRPDAQELSTTVRGWSVTIVPEDSGGWFERDSDGTGGGLWFEDGALVDYDGVACLPSAVADGIRALGLHVPADME